MLHKRVLRPERLRQIPPQFSWVDQRLVRDRRIEGCDTEALALYLVLVTVADRHGLSYYGEARLAQVLSIPIERVIEARARLIDRDLIAYERPLYQVLALDAPATRAAAGMQSIEKGLAQWRERLKANRR